MTKCKQCGVCCRSIVVPLNMRTDKDQFELLKMKANYVKSTHHAGKMWVMLSGQCIHLKDGKCAIYDKRPSVCKEWPKKNLGLWAKLNSECGYCE